MKKTERKNACMTLARLTRSARPKDMANVKGMMNAAKNRESHQARGERTVIEQIRVVATPTKSVGVTVPCALKKLRTPLQMIGT